MRNHHDFSWIHDKHEFSNNALLHYDYLRENAAPVGSPDLVHRHVVALSDFRRQEKQARDELLEALSRAGFCFIASENSSHVLHSLLSELSRFFESAGTEEKSQLKAYPRGLLRGYCPPLEPDSRKLELRKERYVFGNNNNLFPGAYPLLRQVYDEFYSQHIKPIAESVYTSVLAYLQETDRRWARNFQRFFLDPCSGQLEPSVLSYAMHYPPLENPEDFLNTDETVTISDSHVDMTTFTVLPRGTGGATKMFDEAGKIVPIYDGSVSPDAILVFVGKTLEKLLEGIPFKNANGSFPFRAFKHTVRNRLEEVLRARDVVGYFFNGNGDRQYLTVTSGKEFGSMFMDRRPPRMKQLEPLSGAELTVRDRQYLTERLFYSDTSQNSASPPVTLKQFRRVN